MKICYSYTYIKYVINTFNKKSTSEIIIKNLLFWFWKEIFWISYLFIVCFCLAFIDTPTFPPQPSSKLEFLFLVFLCPVSISRSRNRSEATVSERNLFPVISYNRSNSSLKCQEGAQKNMNAASQTSQTCFRHVFAFPAFLSADVLVVI